MLNFRKRALPAAEKSTTFLVLLRYTRNTTVTKGVDFSHKGEERQQDVFISGTSQVPMLPYVKELTSQSREYK